MSVASVPPLRLADDDSDEEVDAERLSRTAEMRAMARVPDGSETTLVELKAVDRAYPLFGTMDLAGGGPLETALERRDGRFGAVADQAVLDRLGLAAGDEVRIGGISLTIRDAIAREPDRAGSGTFTLGPRLMIGMAALEESGLIQPGSMIYWHYRLDLPAETDLEQWRSDVVAAFPEAPWRIRAFDNAAPQLAEFVERLALFLRRSDW